MKPLDYRPADVSFPRWDCGRLLYTLPLLMAVLALLVTFEVVGYAIRLAGDD